MIFKGVHDVFGIMFKIIVLVGEKNERDIVGQGYRYGHLQASGCGGKGVALNSA